MLNALALGGVVFLFVGFWHFLWDRLTSPSDKLGFSTKLGIDIYVLGVTIGLLYIFQPFQVFLGGGALVILLWYLTIRIINLIAFKQKPHALEEHQPLSKWANFGHFLGRLGGDLFVGLAMAVVFLLWFHKFPFLADPEDASMDFVMKMNQCEKSSEDALSCLFREKNEKENFPKMVLLDIDDETHRQWKEPLFTPRDCVKELIDSAVQDKARLIVVDILLSQETPPSSVRLCNSDNQLHSGDQNLREYLANYEKDFCGENKCPPIILVRGLLPPGGLGSSDFEVRKQPVYQTRQGFLEEDPRIIQSPHIQWASPNFWSSTFDGKLRRWWLWQPICEKGKQTFIPSIQLLVAGLNDKSGSNYNNALKDIKNFLSAEIDPKFVGNDCTDKPYELKPLSKLLPLSETIKIKEDEGEVAGGGINQRIMFTMPWWTSQLGKEGEQGSEKEQCASASTRYSIYATFGQQEPSLILTGLSAYCYLQQRKSDSLYAKRAKTEVTDSIVIIGNTHKDAGDRYNTPLGQMPGMMVLVNAIYSLFLNHGQIKFFEWEKIKFEALLIVMIVGLLMLMNVAHSAPFWYWFSMVLITGIVWFICEWLISVPLLKQQGVWIDFSLPVVAIFFHHIVTKFHELGQESKEMKEKLRACTEKLQKRNKQKFLLELVNKGLLELVNKGKRLTKGGLIITLYRIMQQ